LRRRNAIAVLYLILAFVIVASFPLLQKISFLGAYILVAYGAAFMFLAIGIIAYLMIFPEIVLGKDQKLNPSEEGFVAHFEGVMKVLREDERKVCMALWKEGGTALQKDVRWVTGLSKVKTYRVVSRLASRGVIAVEKNGKENRLSLAPWLLKNSADKNP
jgi:predicted membrane channel-forming protein YqfA (hemolysin III family)